MCISFSSVADQEKVTFNEPSSVSPVSVLVTPFPPFPHFPHFPACDDKITFEVFVTQTKFKQTENYRIRSMSTVMILGAKKLFHNGAEFHIGPNLTETCPEN